MELLEYIKRMQKKSGTLADIEFDLACDGVEFRSRRDIAAALRACGWESATNGRRRAWYAPGAARYSGSSWVPALVAVVREYCAGRDVVEVKSLHAVVRSHFGADVVEEAIDRANTVLRERSPDWYLDRSAATPSFRRKAKKEEQ